MYVPDVAVVGEKWMDVIQVEMVQTTANTYKLLQSCGMALVTA